MYQLFGVAAASPPTGVRTTMLRSTSVVVMWNRPLSSDVTGYRVSYSTDASYISESNRMGSEEVNSPSTTSVTLTNLEENTPYTITVQTVSSDGLSTPSEEVPIITRTAGK